MKTVIIDFEMNNPNSGKLIQLGAVCMDLNNGNILKTFNRFINPQEKLTDFIIQLTGITQNDVDNAETQEYVLFDFFKWLQEECGNCKNIYSWGTDYWLLLEESKKVNIRYPDKLRFLNIKEFVSVFRSCMPQSKQRGGLKNAMSLFGLPFPEPAHNALNDSIAAAKLLYFFKDGMQKFLEIKKTIA